MFISSLILLKFIFHQLYKIKHLEKIGIMSNKVQVYLALPPMPLGKRRM